MENRTDVPYIVHEGAMARADRVIKKLWICIILLIVLLVASNAGWLYYESQFEQVTETTTQEVTQDADNGENHFKGGTGGARYQRATRYVPAAAALGG